MLVKEDLNTHLYTEVIDTITREEVELIDEAIDAAEGEAISYLDRFDTEDLFSKEDDDRDKTLLMYLKDITVWHLMAVSNPDTDIDYREKRYNNAISWLQKIQSGKTTPKGWVLISEGSSNEPFLINSDPKRETSF